MTATDLIVIGSSGVAGAATAWQAARRGASVLGLDRLPPGHDRGSSHGETRIIRLAYMESPEYVPLLRRSFALWAELEAATGARLYTETGFLQVGPRGDGSVVAGAVRSAAAHDLALEELDREDVAARFPGLALPEGDVSCVLDPRAGVLAAEPSVEALAAAARAAGADLRSDVTVTGWTPAGDGVRVETDRGAFSAGRLVVAAGVWAGRLLADRGLPLEVRRKELHWLATREPGYRADRGFPVWMLDLPDGVFYGFPVLDDRGLKIAEHTGGTTVRGDPLDVDRTPRPDGLARVLACAGRHLPGVEARRTAHAVCMYALTPDEHYVVASHPEHRQVAFCAGLSGHGFKVAPALGEALVDLALAGRTDHPIDFLGLDRPGLRGPAGQGPIGPSRGDA